VTQPLRIQIALPAASPAVFKALTNSNQLRAWFAEHADVSLSEKRYDFWGRFTPEAPDRDHGRHPLLSLEDGRAVEFGWKLTGQDTTVKFQLEPRGDQLLFVLTQSGIAQSHDSSHFTFEDFWFLSLENLRRFAHGKAAVRCDFTRPMVGDIQHSVEIDGTSDAVFDVLIKPEQLERWIASHATVEPVVGGDYDFGWGMGEPLKILELIPNEKLAISWPEGNGTVVTWTLNASGGKTRLTLVHSGFAPDQPTGGLNAGWLNFASWIKSIVEFGPDWQPAIIQLRPGLENFYPASIRKGQAELITS
jgi:uncharacterized protein YndB with AHSA1/START domain